MPKLPDSDVARIHKAFVSNTLPSFAKLGNSMMTVVRISSGDNVCIRIYNATRADTITGGLTKKRSKKDGRTD